MSIYVNGRKAKRVKFSENGSDDSPGLNWTDRSDIYYLRSGANTFEIRRDPGDTAAGLLIDYLAVSREPTCDEGLNVAPQATATASSGKPAGAISGCPRDEAAEWSAAGAAASGSASLGPPQELSARSGSTTNSTCGTRSSRVLCPSATAARWAWAGFRTTARPARNRLPAQNGHVDQALDRPGQ